MPAFKSHQAVSIRISSSTPPQTQASDSTSWVFRVEALLAVVALWAADLAGLDEQPCLHNADGKLG